MATVTEQAGKLLDFGQKLDITLLDNVVGVMYAGEGAQVGILSPCGMELFNQPLSLCGSFGC
jgi:hypothetical protein